MLPMLQLSHLTGVKSVLLADYDYSTVPNTIDIATANAPWNTPEICDPGYVFFVTLLDDDVAPTKWVRLQLSGGEAIAGGVRFTVDGFGDSMVSPPVDTVFPAGSPVQWVPGNEEFLSSFPKDIFVANTGIPETITCDHTLIIYDGNGDQYKIPAMKVV